MNEKKLYIIKKVAHIYLKRGIKSVTMDDVASELSISKKTLYIHFKDKKELVRLVFNLFLEEMDTMFKTISDKDALEWFFAIRKKMADILKIYNNKFEEDLKKMYPELYNEVMEIKRQRVLTSTIDNMRKGIAEGVYRNDLDPYFIAKIMIGRMIYTVNPDCGIFTNYEINTLAFYDAIMGYHVHAICTEKGLKQYKKRLNNVQDEENN